MKISTAYLSEMGGREKNDDTVCIVQKENSICVFVGDGLGGYDGGKMASEKAAETIQNFHEHHGLMLEQFMQKSVIMADEAVKELQQKYRGNMKTTMAVLAIENQQARWMHVGDTRLYYFTDGTLTEQTMDHSVSQVAVLMGEIKPEEIRFHEDRNRVLRALGSDNAKPDISPMKNLEAKQEAFLLCTDGFWEYVYEAEMEQTLRQSDSPEKWLELMTQYLEKRVPSGNDNYSAAAVFCCTE